MLGLTSFPLLLIIVVLACVAPFLLAFWRNGPGPAPVAVLTRFVAVIIAEALAVGAVFLWTNRSYGFYTSWADLTGGNSQNAPIVTGGGGAARSRTEVLDVRSGASGRETHALVWLPPQYDEPAYAHKRFPVVMFLPGQPSTPNALYAHYSFDGVATKAISSGRVQPFVAVLPPLMTNPPRDTECTDVPDGPQAQTYLAKDVPAALEHSYRVDAPGKAWSVVGWSTGGFCAAKLALSDPSHWASEISFGGYFTPIIDRTTGDLFHGDAELRQRNTPLWLYRQHGTGGTRLLMVAGKQDDESWRPTERMIRATHGDPDVSYIAFPIGGHNYHNYAAYLGPALEWARLPAPN